MIGKILKNIFSKYTKVVDYLSDYYNELHNIKKLLENIKNSGENEIGISFTVDLTKSFDYIIKIINILKDGSCYY
ncbi:MAG: hypothetical protein LBV51_05780 [Acholeplasmatales bacterium]|jgi:hypothetical protein|nr:hypothetical protein [Acholeplasmatales bacterium]